MIKNIFTTAILLFSAALISHAQKFVFVDTEYILERIPEYKQAQKTLDETADKWRQEIDLMYQEIEELYRAYQAEQVLMPEEMKIRKQQEIEDKEKAVKEYQKQKFGYEGELFKKKQELVKPIQDKVYNEIQKLAAEKYYDFVFDKSSGVAMLYANPKYDKSDDILRAMGYSPTSKN